MTCSAEELLDLAGRIMLTHRIAPEHLHRVLGGNPGIARAVVEEGRLDSHLSRDTTARLALFVNVLVRLELRLRGDGRAIRHAIDAPVDTLGGRSPAELFHGDVNDLRALRRAVETIEVPQERWFRVGH